ncbi:hypothetical protein C0992_002065, partial [Termitomyces sp. T32_za158]
LDSTIDELIENSPSESYPPVTAPVLYPEPYVTIKSQPIVPLWLKPDLSNLQVQLIDYGEGIPYLLDIQAPSDALLLAIPLENLSSIKFAEIQLETLRAPEITLGCTLSEKIDIWSVGLMVSPPT